MTAQFRQRIDTTYADLRPSDLVIDKSGQAWPIAELGGEGALVIFWLCDPVTKVKQHLISKSGNDAVKVSRLPTQADEAAKLEAEFPATAGRLSTSPEEQAELQEKFPKGWAPAGTVNDSYLPDSHATMSEAVAAVEETSKLEADFDAVEAVVNGDNFEALADALREVGADGVSMTEAVANAKAWLGGTVEAEVTAAEVDAAAAATEDAPLTIIAFADMTPLEQRSHCYLLHGIFAYDLQGKSELAALHDQAHAATGTLNSRHVPHVHEVK